MKIHAGQTPYRFQAIVRTSETAYRKTRRGRCRGLGYRRGLGTNAGIGPESGRRSSCGQQQTQAEPKLVEWRQKLRPQHAGSKACCRNGKRQRPWSITMHHRPQADERKDACQDDAEVAVRPASNRPICDDCLSIGHRQLYGIDLAPINMMTPPTSTSTNMVTREKALRSIRPATSPRLVA
jgi:hypothetical protein